MPDDHVLQPHDSVMGLKTQPKPARNAMQDAFNAAKEQQNPVTKEKVDTDGKVSS